MTITATYVSEQAASAAFAAQSPKVSDSFRAFLEGQQVRYEVRDLRRAGDFISELTYDVGRHPEDRRVASFSAS